MPAEFSCDLCPIRVTFRQRSRLQKHMREKHLEAMKARDARVRRLRQLFANDSGDLRTIQHSHALDPGHYPMPVSIQQLAEDAPPPIRQIQTKRTTFTPPASPIAPPAPTTDTEDAEIQDAPPLEDHPSSAAPPNFEPPTRNDIDEPTEPPCRRFSPPNIKVARRIVWRPEPKVLREDHSFQLDRNLEKGVWRNFTCGFTYAMGNWMLHSSLSQKNIDEFFNLPLARAPYAGASCSEEVRRDGPRCFTSGTTWADMLDNVDPDLHPKHWKPRVFKAGNFPGYNQPIQYWSRPIEGLIRNILKQPYLDGHFQYSPERWYGVNGERIIGPAYTGDNMWREQASHPKDHFIILLLGMSDPGDLSKFAGDKTINPANFTIANIDPEMRDNPTMACTRTFALLPTKLPKFEPSRAIPKKLEPIISRQVVHSVLWECLRDLEALQRNGMEVVCPDGKVRVGHPYLTGWLADLMEYSKIFAINSRSCPVCLAPTSEMDAHPTQKPSLRRTRVQKELAIKFNQELHNAVKYAPGTPEADPKLFAEADKNRRLLENYCLEMNYLPVENAFWKLQNVDPATLWRPDVLHTLDIGIMQYLMDWTMALIEDFPPLDAIFDVLWTKLSHHPSLTRKPNKSWRAIVQKQGTEHRTAATLLLAVLEATVESFETIRHNAPTDEFSRQRGRRERAAQDQQLADEEEMDRLSDVLAQALNCIAAFVDFHKFAYMKYHTHTFKEGADDDDFDVSDTTFERDSTLRQMHLALIEFLETVPVFRYWKVKAANKKTGQAEADAVQAPEVSAGKTAAQREAENAAYRRLREEARRAAIEEQERFNTQKFHIIKHFCTWILAVGALPESSTSSNEINLGDYKEGFAEHTNKDVYDNQLFRYVGHLEAMRAFRACLIDLLERGKDIPPDIRRDIELHLGLFQTVEDRDACRAENRVRMNPSKLARMEERRIAQEERKQLEEQELRLLEEEFGGPAFNLNDHNDLDCEADEESLTLRQRKLRKAAMLTLENGIYQRIENEPPTPPRIRLGHELRMSPPIFSVSSAETAVPLPSFANELWVAMNREGRHLPPGEQFLHLPVKPFSHIQMAKLIDPFKVPVRWNTSYRIRCTAKRPWGRTKQPRGDFVAYVSGTKTPLSGERIGQLQLLFTVRLGRDELPYVALRPMDFLQRTEDQAHRRTYKLGWADESMVIIPLQSITRGVSVVPILRPHRWKEAFEAPKDIYEEAIAFILNNRIDEETFNTFI